MSSVDNKVSPEIEGDESVPYANWAEYEEAVDTGEELAPVKVEVKKRPDYEFDVDNALDNIDLTFGNYTPSVEAIAFFDLIGHVLGEDTEVSNSLMHFFLVDLVFDNVKRENFPYAKHIQDKIRLNPKKIAIIASRMSAKSTVITAYLPIYLAITGTMPNFGKIGFVVGFGDSQQAGAKVQAHTIRDFCEDSKFCKDYFESMRFTDEECEFIRKGEGKVKDRAFMYKVKGAAGGSVRGIRYRTKRPEMFLFDDIIKNEAEASSAVIMNKLRSMIYSDATRALGSKGKIVAVNTPFNKKDPIYSALESGIWTPICLPICEKISLELKKEEYVGNWEQMHSYEKLISEYEDAYYGDTLKEFNQELMLRISSEEDRLVKDDQIGWYSIKSLGQHLDGYTIFVTSDLTASNDLKGDYSVIMVWAVNSNNDRFLLDLSVKKQTIDGQFNTLMHMVQRWTVKTGKHLEVGIEIDGQQQLNIDALRKMQLARNMWFNFARQIGASPGKEGISRRRAGGDKHAQFMRVHGLFQAHKIFFPEEFKGSPDMMEVLDELKYITYTVIASKNDDALDGISMMGSMDIILPSADAQTVEVPESNSSIWGSYFDEEEESEGDMSTVF